MHITRLIQAIYRFITTNWATPEWPDFDLPIRPPKTHIFSSHNKRK
jgi:hypothetical protein